MPPLNDTAGGAEVGVIVVTHNSAPVIEACLASLPDALCGVGDWTITVVDNASADHTTDLVAEQAPDARVIQVGRNAGYAAAINAGVASLGSERYVLILNPDLRLAPGCATPLIEAVDRPGVGMAVPPLINSEGELSHSLRRRPTLLRATVESLIGGTRASVSGRLGEVVGDPAQYRYEHPVDWATGALMMVSRGCLEEVGEWDESFFLYSEETDFCLRAQDRGYLTWFTPCDPSLHIGGESTTSPYLWSVLTVNRVRAYRKRHRLPAAAAFWAATVLGEAVRGAAGSRRHRAALHALLGGSTAVRPGESETAAETDRTQEPPWICFSAQDWWYHNRAHSDFQLMRRIARERPVLFVNSIGMRMPAPGRSTQVTRRIIRKARSVLRFVSQPLPDTPGFHVVTPLILPFYGSPALRSLNARLVRAQIQLIARHVGIDVSDAVILVTIPTAWDVVAPMGRRAVLANRSDLHSAFEETDQDMIRGLESKLLVNSDAVVYTSRSLMDSERPLSGDRSFFLDHGVDLSRFGEVVGPRPQDIADLEGPIVGFFGGLDDYVVDLDLLGHVARELPEATLLLIGDATCPIDELTNMANVRWLGFRPYEEIPAYGATFDVALMPWLRNDWIEHSNPIKLKEYLALGTPVVSTDFPEVRYYSDVVAVAGDPDEFLALVRAALEGQAVGTTEQRRARVAGASWDRRAEELLALGENTHSLS